MNNRNRNQIIDCIDRCTHDIPFCYIVPLASVSLDHHWIWNNLMSMEIPGYNTIKSEEEKVLFFCFLLAMFDAGDL